MTYERWRMDTSGVKFVKTVGVGEAWGLATNGVWGRRNYALSNPQSLKFMFLLRLWPPCFEKKHTNRICFLKL